MAVNGNYGSNPNYPSSYRELTYKKVVPTIPDEHQKWTEQAVYHLNEVTPDDYIQAGNLWNVLGKQEGQQDNFVHNVAVHLSAAKKDTRNRTYDMFTKVNSELGSRIQKETEKLAPNDAKESARL